MAKASAAQLGQRVLRYCAKWGITVKFEAIAASVPAEHIHKGPSRGHLEWPARIIWFGEAPFHQTEPSALLHELSHCVIGEKPSYVDEVESGMLAFEWFSQRRLKLSRDWSAWQEDYIVDTECDNPWGAASVKTRHRAIMLSLEAAATAGILTPDGRPTYRPCPIAGITKHFCHA